MQILIEANADVDVVDAGGYTAIPYAPLWRRLNCLQQLIDNGADVNVDARNLVDRDKRLVSRRVAASIEEYKRMHTYTDNQHTVTKKEMPDMRK
jgi:ankyrin repeat protein